MEKEERKKKRRHPFRNIVTVLLLIVLAAGAGVSVFFRMETGTTLSACYREAAAIAADMSEDDFRMNGTTEIYYADGSLMAEIRQGESSHYLYYEDIPEAAVNAFVAIEDQTFWENDGYDLKGIARAGLSYILSDGETLQGGSTITQQLVKLVYLSSDKTLERKVKELVLAKAVTENYGKEQIMEWYVNYCCFANNIYGLKDAAEAYLGKDVSELSLSEICYLCAIPNRPEYYNPWNDPETALSRRDRILSAMLSQGMISQEEYDSAVAEEITVVDASSSGYTQDDATLYAVYCAAEVLMEEDGFTFENDFETMDDYETYQEEYETAYEAAVQELYTGGYTVYTSLVPEYQEALQEALDDGLSSGSSSVSDDGVYNFQGALTAVENSTSKVVGIVGRRSQDGVDNVNYNRAFQFYRQPGSSIKPLIVYTPALMDGYTDSTRLKEVSVQSAYSAWKNGNSVQSLSGTRYTLRNAVTWSRNGCALYVYSDVTPSAGLSYLLSMGFSRIVPDDYYLSSALGGLTYGVNTVEMAGAYSALANYGTYTAADCLMSLLDSSGNELYTQPESAEVYSSDAATLMTDILEDVISSGTARGMGWSSASSLSAAGKTGTTDDNRNGWFCGYTAPYTIAVWVGNDDNTTVSGLTGSSYPASIWKSAMLALTDGWTGDEGIFGSSVSESGTSGVPGTWYVVSGGANVRDSGSSHSNVLFSLSGGTAVYVVEMGEYWSEVQIDGNTYYIYTPLLEQ